MDFNSEPTVVLSNCEAEEWLNIQRSLIRQIRKCLEALALPNHTILWDHDHDSRAYRPAEEPALYTGEKVRGQGRICRNGAVDVLMRIENPKTVPLLVEVEPVLEPKKLWGLVGFVADSDRHVPSNKYCSPSDDYNYFLKQALLIIMTICASGKAERLQAQVRRVRDRFHLPSPEVRDVLVCAGDTTEGAVTEFKSLIESEFRA